MEGGVGAEDGGRGAAFFDGVGRGAAEVREGFDGGVEGIGEDGGGAGEAEGGLAAASRVSCTPLVGCSLGTFAEEESEGFEVELRSRRDHVANVAGVKGKARGVQRATANPLSLPVTIF